jgi:hypothetical protein
VSENHKDVKRGQAAAAVTSVTRIRTENTGRGAIRENGDRVQARCFGRDVPAVPHVGCIYHEAFYVQDLRPNEPAPGTCCSYKNVARREPTDSDKARLKDALKDVSLRI